MIHWEAFVETRPGGEERIVVDGPSLLVGSGAHCEISLAADQAAREHVRLTMEGEVLRVALLASEPQVTVDGQLVTEGTSVTGDEVVLTVGGARLRIVARRREDAARAPSRVPAVLGGVGVIVVAALVAFVTHEVGRVRRAPEVPVLFARADAVCSVTERDRALAVAEDQLLSARARRERWPFAPEDGPQAVALYDAAAACFRAAGEVGRAGEAEADADGLRDLLHTDVRSRALRFEYALRGGDLALARNDFRVLRTLTKGTRSPFRTWLERNESRLELPDEEKSR